MVKIFFDNDNGKHQVLFLSGCSQSGTVYNNLKNTDKIRATQLNYKYNNCPISPNASVAFISRKIVAFLKSFRKKFPQV